jgi:AraC family L-rhamnose operon regulatory protein RhaS
MFAAKADRPVEEHLPAWGVFVLESHHSARFRMDRTRSPFLKVIYVLKGRGELKFDSGPRPVSRGSVVVVPLGLPGAAGRLPWPGCAGRSARHRGRF